MRIRYGITVMAMWLPIAIFAAPPLSTIEDVLYKADGSKFNGVAFVEWKSFQAADFSSIATHSVTVTILDGAIRVQLVPTTNASPGAYYSVRYHSDGRVQFDEIWAVPPSTVPLKLRNVRVATPLSGGQVVPPPAQTTLQESDVAGLIDDLDVRPLMGPGFAPSRAAYISDTGALEAVQGSLDDCVRVDGTAGPCGAGAAPGFVDAEIPAGLMDGSNTVFTLADVPSPPSSLALYRNGVLQTGGVDYILMGAEIDFAAGSVPQLDDILVCSYRTASPGGALAQNSSQLNWDDTNRRLSVGNSLAQATLYLYDAQPSTGLTNLVVRGGQGQGANPLQTWLDPNGAQLGQVDAAGNVAAASFGAVTTASRAAWRDAGSSSDPSTRTDGDVWYNTAAQARRSAEGGQTHTLPQVICSSTGSGSNSTTLTRLGSCTVPANFLKPGDRVDVRFSYSHEGTARAFTFEIHWGATTILSRAGATSDTRVVGQAEFGVYSGGALWNTQSWGSSLAFAAAVGDAADLLTTPVVIDLLGKMASSTTDTITLRNFTVIRYPAQANP